MANYGYNPGVIDVVKGPYLTAGAPDRTLPTALVLNRGDIVTESNGTWVAPAGTLTELLYVVTTPTDKVGAFAGNATSIEGVGNDAGLGSVPKPSVITPLKPGVLGTAGDGATIAPDDPIGTSRSSAGKITEGTHVATAIPLAVAGSEFRISQFADSDGTKGGSEDIAVGSRVDSVSGKLYLQYKTTGRWQVTGEVEPYYLNNLVTKTYGGTVARQGGIINTIKVTPLGPVSYTA